MKKQMLLNRHEIAKYDGISSYIAGISTRPQYRYTFTIAARKRQRTAVESLLALHVNNLPFLKRITERIELLTLLIASMEHIKLIEYGKTNYPILYVGNYVDRHGKVHITEPYTTYGRATQGRTALRNRVEKKLSECIVEEDSHSI